jgi:hypothetical protein
MTEIVQRSDGLPLYIEELAVALVDHDARKTATAQPHDRVPVPRTVPSSLRDLLTSRLDDVGPARQVAQFAAALGREFAGKMLVTLYERDELEVAGDLEQLVTSQILIKRSSLDGGTYMFRHALIRDAAYDGMAEPARQRTHERIARGLELWFPQLADEQADVLAHHWERAREPRRAIECWHRAAQRSGMASAHLEAIQQLDRALSLVEGLPPGEQTPELVTALSLSRGAAIMAKRGFADPEAGRSFERVATMAPVDGDRPQLAFAGRWGLWYFHNCRAELRRAYELARELGTLAATKVDPTFAVSASEALCTSAFCTGMLSESIAASRRCEAEYDFEQHRHLTAFRGNDPLVASLSFEAFAELLVGHPDLAIQRIEQGIALAERLGYWTLRAGIQGQAAWLHLQLGTSGALIPDVSASRRHAEIAIRIGMEQGFPFWAGFGSILDNCARIASGDLSALPELRASSAMWGAAGAALGRCWHLAFTAEALHAGGEHEAALAVLDESLAFCETSNSRYVEADVLRRRAAILLDPLNPGRNAEQGLAACAAAIEHAARHGTDWWMLAACTTRVRAPEGASPANRAELQAIVDKVSSSAAAEPPLLREARALLKPRFRDDDNPDRLSP